LLMTIIWEVQERTPEYLYDRPYVILNAAMTLDGKIATRSRDSEISSQEDLTRVHQLRASVDAIVVGVETVLADDPQLTAYRVAGKNPIRVILDSVARTPTTARVLRRDSARTLVAVTESAPKERIDALLSAGAEILVTGSGERADISSVMNILHKLGVNKVLVEGGGNVNWSLIRLGLVDEIRVSVAPVIVGGKDAVTLVEGEGMMKVSDGIKLLLQRIEQYGNNIVLTYRSLWK
jgi:2,5-diamino-6-(ribosylamino)-4(3H)-pyrimidinone 5'-phosphate reductase